MSHYMTEENQQQIVDEVCKVWKLPDRDDLLADCISFVDDNYEYYRGVLEDDLLLLSRSEFSTLVKDLVIKFLSSKCADAMSGADLEAMAREESDISFNSYEDATSGV